MDDLDLALYYYSKKLAIDRELGKKEGEATALNNIAEIYRKKEITIKLLNIINRL